MDSLKDKLIKFKPFSTSELNRKFNDLAESFLYGGYVSVKDYKGQEWYRVYPRTIEFYCHYEGNNIELPKDPIVYHRNGKYIQGDVPYFPLMAFHAHASGIDITFEKEELELRSSVLIRAYEVYDVRRNIFLTFDKKSKKFVECKNKNERINQQSTYLYNFLNGFIGNSVEWIDSVRGKAENFKTAPRKNVFRYKEEEKTLEKDDREWSYTRIEDLPF